jgi:AcrR family transcriptional regulator
VRADALRNRERLVEVAQDAFARDGVETSLEEIARSAGVGIGTLYRRFPTREDLIAAVLNERYQFLISRAEVYAADLSPQEALAAWLGDFVEHLAVYKGLAMVVKEAIHDPTTALGMTCRDLLKIGDRLLGRGQDAGHFRPDVMFYDVLSMCSGISFAAERRAEKDDPSVPPLDRNLLLDILLRGLRPE